MPYTRSCHCIWRIENRVEITNGTAAVCTLWMKSVDESQSLVKAEKAGASASEEARCESEKLLKAEK